jgi:hypothetical protein
MYSHPNNYLPNYNYNNYKQWKGDWELIQGIPFLH